MNNTTSLLVLAAISAPCLASAEPTPIHVGLVGEGGSADVRGFDLGLVVSRAERVRGVQLAVGAGLTGRELTGLQLATAIAHSRGTAIGLQLAGGAAISSDLEGAQVAPVTLAGQLSGLQLGAINVGASIHGAQIGAVNLATEARGLQLGAINAARRSRGLVIGAINVLGEHDGEAIGVLTFARNGVHDVSVFTSDTMAANAALRLGGKHLYTAFHVAYQPGETSMTYGQFDQGTKRFGTGLGIGWRVRVGLGPIDHLDIEGIGMGLRHSAFGSEAGRLAAFRVQAALRLAPHLHVVAGFGINLTVTNSDEMVDLDRSGVGASGTVSGHDVRLFPGFVLGVSS